MRRDLPFSNFATSYSNKRRKFKIAVIEAHRFQSFCAPGIPGGIGKKKAATSVQLEKRRSLGWGLHDHSPGGEIFSASDARWKQFDLTISATSIL